MKLRAIYTGVVWYWGTRKVRKRECHNEAFVLLQQMTKLKMLFKQKKKQTAQEAREKE